MHTYLRHVVRKGRNWMLSVLLECRIFFRSDLLIHKHTNTHVYTIKLTINMLASKRQAFFSTGEPRWVLKHDIWGWKSNRWILSQKKNKTKKHILGYVENVRWCQFKLWNRKHNTQRDLHLKSRGFKTQEWMTSHEIHLFLNLNTKHVIINYGVSYKKENKEEERLVCS